jgi:hypothetical protein
MSFSENRLPLFRDASQAEPDRQRRQMSSRDCAELPAHIVEMKADSRFGDSQMCCNVMIGQSAHQQSKAIALALRWRLGRAGATEAVG